MEFEFGSLAKLRAIQTMILSQHFPQLSPFGMMNLYINVSSYVSGLHFTLTTYLGFILQSSVNVSATLDIAYVTCSLHGHAVCAITAPTLDQLNNFYARRIVESFESSMPSLWV